MYNKKIHNKVLVLIAEDGRLCKKTVLKFIKPATLGAYRRNLSCIAGKILILNV